MQEQTDRWRAELRVRMRTARASLDKPSLDHVAARVLHHLDASLAAANNLAAYLAIGGEVPVDATLYKARSHGANTYVPQVIDTQMQFVRIDHTTRFTRNRFGILEPEDIDPPGTEPMLDLVLVPLVAFDDHGHRVGMGGGFYDRYFAASRYLERPRPQLIGVAHDFQRVDSLQPMPWDVPLDAIVTESGLVNAKPLDTSAN